LSKIKFLTGDLREENTCQSLVNEWPDAIVHMAAETHVDRSINDPMCFVDSNIKGTVQLLQAIVMKKVWPNGWPKLLVYSTDEVYGPTPEGQRFTEEQGYNPSNAYSASKVGIEAYCNAFKVTHNLQPIIVRPCNTYGPGQFPEKLIPYFVNRMLEGQWVPLFGKGEDKRDWLHATDHAKAIETLIRRGVDGESYNVAAHDERTNYEVTTTIYKTLKEEGLLRTDDNMSVYIKYVDARPGHDRRYWMEGSKLRRIGWEPKVPFEKGLKETILWYANHPEYHKSDLYSYPG
jgi:dTDP-glucose 4,6-dehydratase